MEEKIIQKNKTKAISVSLGNFNGKNFIQIMERYLTEDGKWGFTKKNLTFNNKTYPQILKTLLENHNEICEHISIEKSSDELIGGVLDDLNKELND